MAPGVNISSTAPDGKYTHMSGTSAAAPFLTGTIALLWSLSQFFGSRNYKFAYLKKGT